MEEEYQATDNNDMPLDDSEPGYSSDDSEMED